MALNKASKALILKLLPKISPIPIIILEGDAIPNTFLIALMTEPAKLLTAPIAPPVDANTPLLKEDMKLTLISFSPPPLPNADVALLNTFLKIVSLPKSFFSDWIN